MSLYNAKTDTGTESYGVSQFIVTKFDDDLNVEASYLVSSQGCTCPAGHRPSCRHRQMLPMLETRVNSAFFLDFDTRKWVDPTGEAKTTKEDIDRGEAAASEASLGILPPYSGEPVDHSDAIIAADEKLNLGPQDSLDLEMTPLGTTGYGETKAANTIPNDAMVVDSLTGLFNDAHPFRRRM